MKNGSTSACGTQRPLCSSTRHRWSATPSRGVSCERMPSPSRWALDAPDCSGVAWLPSLATWRRQFRGRPRRVGGRHWRVRGRGWKVRGQRCTV